MSYESIRFVNTTCKKNYFNIFIIPIIHTLYDKCINDLNLHQKYIFTYLIFINYLPCKHNRPLNCYIIVVLNENKLLQ